MLPRMMTTFRPNLSTAFSATLCCLCLVIPHLALASRDTPVITDCVKVSTCSCRSSTLGLVDLSPLANSDGSPRYLNVPSGVEFYSWNPCTPFSLGTCTNVAACQKITFSTSNYYNLGTQATAMFTVNDGSLLVSYSANTDYVQQGNSSANFLRTAYIKLVCDVNSDPGKFVALGEDPSSYGNYHFTLTSIHACPDKVKASRSETSLSVGSCMLITLTILLILYLSIGTLVQVFVFKRSGRDALPNKTVWTTLPGLVKDGTMFVLRRGKNPAYEEFK